MAIYFTNPANNDRVLAVGELSWLWAFLFGPFYFAYKGIWTHALICLVAAVFTAGLSQLIYPFLAKRAVLTHYREKAWLEDAGNAAVRAASLPSDDLKPLRLNSEHPAPATRSALLDKELHFGRGERPEGSWRQAATFQISGLHHFKAEAREFLDAVDACERNGGRHGMDVQRDDSDPRYPNAIRVIGWWQPTGAAKYEAVYLGWVPSEELPKIPRDAPIAAELADIAVEEWRKGDGGDWIEIHMHLLMPSVRSSYWKDREAPFRK